MRILCRACRALLGREFEVLTIGIIAPAKCNVCGTIAARQGSDFDAVDNAIAEEAHIALCYDLRRRGIYAIAPRAEAP